MAEGPYNKFEQSFETFQQEIKDLLSGSIPTPNLQAVHDQIMNEVRMELQAFKKEIIELLTQGNVPIPTPARKFTFREEVALEQRRLEEERDAKQARANAILDQRYPR